MANDVGAIFGQFSHIMAICPNDVCGHVFPLSDARPYLDDKRPHSIFDKIEAASERLDRAIERLEERESELRAKAKALGLKSAKRRLKKIDPVFSGARIDPQDVKVIFDPVEYVIFDGMNRDRLRRVLFLAHSPSSQASERILISLEKSIRAGNVSFKTLRVLEDGRLELK